MQRCPHCSKEVILKELPHQGLFKSHRVCPECGGCFTADTDTKYRQALFIVIALLSLVFTLFLYYEDPDWLIPALASYVALGIVICWGNKKMFLVPYNKNKNNTDDT
jgi:ribosomal protein S27AE